MFTDVQNFSAVSEVNVSFSFLPESFETGEDFFLEVSSNGGSTFTTIEQWVVSSDFTNGERQNADVTIGAANLSANTVIRIRCDASANQDIVYVDDVVIETCESGLIGPTVDVALAAIAPKKDESLTNRESETFVSIPELAADVHIWPNPVYDELRYEVSEATIGAIQIYDTNGREVMAIDNINGVINTSKLDSGLYFLSIRINDKTIVKNFMKL